MNAIESLVSKGLIDPETDTLTDFGRLIAEMIASGVDFNEQKGQDNE